MNKPSLSQGGSVRSFSRYISPLIQTGVALSVLLSGIAVATPSTYAWWFNQPQPQSAVTPMRAQGRLVLSPLAQMTFPKFMLQPLQQSAVEIPPSMSRLAEQNSSPTPIAALTVVPTQKLVLTPIRTATPSPLLASPTIDAHSPIEVQILSLVNGERTSRGLVSLRLNAQLGSSAQKYAQEMQTKKFFSHTSPEGQTFKERNEAAGYTSWSWMGENIAYGQTSAVQVMKEWMASAGHKANILEPRARELGVGYTASGTPYWVQEFGLSR